MKKIVTMLTIAFLPACLLAADGPTLINQASVTAAGGFPYVITQPGSYKLTSNLTPPISADVIHINSNNVTLDLNGFTIGYGACVERACASTGFGINSSRTQPVINITVRNGIISGMGWGVYLNADAVTLEDLHIRSILSQGIIVVWTSANGPGSVIVRHNTIDGAGAAGLVVVGNALVTDNTFSYNGVGASIGSQTSTAIAPAMVVRNTFFSNAIGLVIYHGGYLDNAFGGGTSVNGAGVNLGGNLCNNTLCP